MLQFADNLIFIAFIVVIKLEYYRSFKGHNAYLKCVISIQSQMQLIL